MDITIHTYLVVCPLIFLAGLVDSIAGGGGLISLPAFMLSGIPPHYAIGTNKFANSIGTTVSTIRYCKNRYVNWLIAIPSIVLALIGSAIGANLVLLVKEDVIKYLLLFILPVVAYFVLKGKHIKEEDGSERINKRKLFIVACLAALMIGAYDGFYGPGTGTFLILIYTGILHMDIRTASGNTKVVNLASNIAALVTFIINHKIVFTLGIAAAVCSVAGHYIGSGMVIKNGHKIIRPIIIVVLSLLFIKVISNS